MDISYTKKDENYLLKVTVEQNAVGIIYKVAAVLYNYGWEIMEAVIETIPGSMIKDIFIIRNISSQELTEQTLLDIKQDFSSLLYNEISLPEYIDQIGLSAPSSSNSTNGNHLNLFNPPTIDSTVLDIQTERMPEKLILITGILFTANIDIVSLIVKTDPNFERYSFLLKKDNGERISHGEIEQLKLKLLPIS